MQIADRMTARSGVEITADEILESPHFFIGSIPELTQKVVELRERFGISSFMLGDIEPVAPLVEALAGR